MNPIADPTFTLISLNPSNSVFNLFEININEIFYIKKKKSKYLWVEGGRQIGNMCALNQST